MVALSIHVIGIHPLGTMTEEKPEVCCGANKVMASVHALSCMREAKWALYHCLHVDL